MAKSHKLLLKVAKMSFEATVCLTYVKYRDHVLFKKCNHSDMKPSIREVVGWLVHETQEAIYICCDRSVDPLPCEKPSESGLVILKSDILERREIE
jgi:hypothetical protein